MKRTAGLALAALCAASAPCGAAGFDESSWAAPVAAAGLRAAARPGPPAPPDPAEALRSALRARAARNPVAAEFALPILADDAALVVAERSESEDAGLRGAWASYRRDRRALVVNLDAAAEDARARSAAPPDAAALADRFLAVFVHEVGGHARHYAELGRILGAPAPNVRETEVCALWLEAMAVAAERRLNPGYLRDDAPYAADETRLVDKYWESKRAGDFEIFRAYVSATPAYAELPSAYEGAWAASPVAAYFRAEEARIRDADRRLVGDARPGDESAPDRRAFDDGRSFRR